MPEESGKEPDSASGTMSRNHCINIHHKRTVCQEMVSVSIISSHPEPKTDSVFRKANSGKANIWTKKKIGREKHDIKLNKRHRKQCFRGCSWLCIMTYLVVANPT